MGKNKKLIVIVIFIGASAVGLIWFGRFGSWDYANTISTASVTVTDQSPIGALEVSERFFDFGSISMARGKVIHSFRAKNVGTGPISVEKLYTSCMCTSASFIKGTDRFGPFGMAGHGFIPRINQQIAAGEEFQVEVVFDPAAHGPAGIGRIDRAVYVETAENGTFEFHIAALVIP